MRSNYSLYRAGSIGFLFPAHMQCLYIIYNHNILLLDIRVARILSNLFSVEIAEESFLYNLKSIKSHQ